MRRILAKFFARPAGVPVSAPALLPIEPEGVIDLFDRAASLPMIDWELAMEHAGRVHPSEDQRDLWLRSLAAHWLTELGGRLADAHTTWRTVNAEGLAPSADDLAVRIARTTERAFAEIQRALGRLWDGCPISPVAVVALARNADYVTMSAGADDAEGEFATSGGCYLHGPFPMILFPVNMRWAVESTIAHELTHHALKHLSLPLWVEEGLTQMMEERVTGSTDFRLDAELIQRHRARWGDSRIDSFWHGSAFHSAHEDDQELAYHLAELLARRLLADRPKAFFAFARACEHEDLGAAAASRHLGMTLGQIAAGSLGPGEWEPSAASDDGTALRE